MLQHCTIAALGRFKKHSLHVFNQNVPLTVALKALALKPNGAIALKPNVSPTLRILWRRQPNLALRHLRGDIFHSGRPNSPRCRCRCTMGRHPTGTIVMVASLQTTHIHVNLQVRVNDMLMDSLFSKITQLQVRLGDSLVTSGTRHLIIKCAAFLYLCTLETDTFPQD